MLLDDVANITESDSRLDYFDSLIETFLGDPNQAFGMIGGVTDAEHLAGVTMEAILDNCYVDIDDIARLENLVVAGDAVANHVIDRGADGFRETVIVERSWYGVLDINNVAVADAIQFASTDAWNDMGTDHFEDFRCQAASDSHFIDLFRRLYVYWHRVSVYQEMCRVEGRVL